MINRSRSYLFGGAALVIGEASQDLFDLIGIKGRDFVEWLPVVPRFQFFLVVIA